MARGLFWREYFSSKPRRSGTHGVPVHASASRALLEHWGCRVTLAAGAADALPLAMPNDVPDLVLLDYHLADRTGPEVLDELIERWSALPSVVLVTAERGGEPEAQSKEREWGLIHKPIRPAALRAVMKLLLVKNAVT